MTHKCGGGVLVPTCPVVSCRPGHDIAWVTIATGPDINLWLDARKCLPHTYNSMNIENNNSPLM